MQQANRVCDSDDFGQQRGRRNPHAARSAAQETLVIRTSAITESDRAAQVLDALEAADQAAQYAASDPRAHYALLIQWSESERTYLVTLPEWHGRSTQPVARGSPRGEAARHGHDGLRALVEETRRAGEPLPPPQICAAY